MTSSWHMNITSTQTKANKIEATHGFNAVVHIKDLLIYSIATIVFGILCGAIAPCNLAAGVFFGLFSLITVLMSIYHLYKIIVEFFMCLANIELQASKMASRLS